MEHGTTADLKLSYRLFLDGDLVEEQEVSVDSVTLGRADTNLIVLDNEVIADLHAVVKLTKEQKLFLTDLGSDEGTFVNDDPVDMRAEIASGAEIKIGPFLIVFDLTLPVVPTEKKAESPRAGHLKNKQLVDLVFESWDHHDQARVDNVKARKVIELFEIWGDTILSAQQYPRSVSSIKVAAESRKSRADYVIAEEDLPKRPFEMIGAIRGVPHLRFGAKPDGDLFVGDQTMTLADAIRSGLARKQPKDDIYEVPLTEDTRFELRLGPVSFLGTSCYPARKPIGANKSNVDGLFLSLLLLIGLLFGSSTLYMLTLPPPPEMDISQIPDRFAKMLVPKTLEKKEEAPKKEIRATTKKKKEEEPKVEKESTKRDTTTKKKYDKVDIDQAALDKKIAERSGLLGELSKGDSSKGLFGQGLGSGVLSGVAGLLGTTGSSSIAGAPAGSRGLGFGGGGAAGSIGGVGTKGGGGGDGDGGYGTVTRKKTKASAEIDVSGGDAIVLGALDKSVIDKVIRDHLSSIRYCYQRELVRNPRLAGKVTIKFTISGDGSVSQSNVKASTMENAGVEQCVSLRIRQLRFPEPRGGGIVTVSYPFFFKAAG